VGGQPWPPKQYNPYNYTYSTKLNSHHLKTLTGLYGIHVQGYAANNAKFRMGRPPARLSKGKLSLACRPCGRRGDVVLRKLGSAKISNVIQLDGGDQKILRE